MLEKSISGQKFGRLTAIKLIKKENYKIYWLFRCDCGKEIIRVKWQITAPSAETVSCGCYSMELRKKFFNEYNPKKTHGMTGTRFYRIWCAMLGRCRNKNHSCFYKYGAKGIVVCKKWLKFENFKDDMYESYQKHTKDFGEKNTQIDRIDNNNYELFNCRWVTLQEQARNKSNIKLITFNKKTMILCDWAKELKIPYSRLSNRIYKYKWSIKRAFTE